MEVRGRKSSPEVGGLMSTSLACSELFCHWASLNLCESIASLSAAISASAGLTVICPDKNRKRREIRGKLAASSSPGH